MTQYLNETFSSGSFLDGKSADVGGPWSNPTNNWGTANPSIGSGRVNFDTTSPYSYINSASPGDSVQDISLEFTPNADNWLVGCVARYQTTGGAQLLCWINSATFTVVKLASATDWPGTTLCTATPTLAAGDRASHTLRFKVSASGVMEVWLDGASVTLTGTTTDNTLTASGSKSGFWGRGGSSTQITADDGASGAPIITGPSGAAGAGSSSKSVAEGVTAVHTFTADVAVSWSKNGGADEADFTINSSTGALDFAPAPDFEAAGDSDTNNTYVVVVRATATVGGATADQTVTVTVTNASEPPLAPTIATATAGNASASVAFTPPSNTGRPAITGYTATSSPGGLTGTGASSPITVSGLTNGTAYTFTVAATNADGTGPASAASNSVTPSAGVSAGSFNLNNAIYTFKRKDNVVLASLGVTFFVNNHLTGELIGAAITGLSTNASGIVTTPVSNASVVAGTTYRLSWRFSSGEYGQIEMQAA